MSSNDNPPEGLLEREPTYHGTKSAYVLPNDKQEKDRLAIQHEAILALMKNRFYFAPIQHSEPDAREPLTGDDEPVFKYSRTMADVGCGTGITTRRIAATCPDARVYGIDLSPVPSLPTDEKDLPNLQFLQGNFMELAGTDLRLPDESLDFIHSRLLICGITDWTNYLQTAYSMLKPGGWMQLIEINECIYYDNDIDSSGNNTVPSRDWEWLRELRTGLKSKGLDPDAASHVKERLKETGFEEIQEWQFKVPLWKGFLEDHPEATKAYELYLDDRWGLFWHMMGMVLKDGPHSPDKVRELQEQMKKDFREEKGKYNTFVVTIGKKPGGY